MFRGAPAMKTTHLFLVLLTSLGGTELLAGPGETRDRVVRVQAGFTVPLAPARFSRTWGPGFEVSGEIQERRRGNFWLVAAIASGRIWTDEQGFELQQVGDDVNVVLGSGGASAARGKVVTGGEIQTFSAQGGVLYRRGLSGFAIYGAALFGPIFSTRSPVTVEDGRRATLPRSNHLTAGTEVAFGIGRPLSPGRELSVEARVISDFGDGDSQATHRLTTGIGMSFR